MQIIRNQKIFYIPATHEDVENPGVVKKVLFDKKLIPNGRIEMINWAKIQAGKSFQPHYHEDMAEIFIIVSGQGIITVENESSKISKGDAVIIPEKCIHHMQNSAKTSLVYVVIGISQGKNGKTVVVSRKT